MRHAFFIRGGKAGADDVLRLSYEDLSPSLSVLVITQHQFKAVDVLQKRPSTPAGYYSLALEAFPFGPDGAYAGS